MTKNRRILYSILIIVFAPIFLITLFIDIPIAVEETTTEDYSEIPVLEIETESEDEVLEKVANLVAKNLDDKNYDIYFKGSNIICIDVYQEGLSDKVSNIILTSDYSGWNKIIGKTCEIVNNVKFLLNSIGYDYTVCWTWCDNFEGEKTPFLICENGVIIFDMVKTVLIK
jgi:hypothetical protein